MISEIQAKRYCSEDISKIENYDKAIDDTTQTWECHHRGEILPCGRFSKADLEKFGLYENRPASELVFMTASNHASIHDNWNWTGKHHSEATKKKLSEKAKGRYVGRPATWLKNKKQTEEHKQKNREAQLGMKFWNNGKITIKAKECPGAEWKRGICKK